MRFTDPHQLVVGTEVFLTHAFRDRSNGWIEHHEVTAVQVPTKLPNCWFNEFKRLDLWPGCTSITFDLVRGTFEERNKFGHGHIREQSLQDMGVIQNTYNDHQSFSTLIEAADYLLDFFGARLTFTAPQWYVTHASNQAQSVCDYDRAMSVVK